MTTTNEVLAAYVARDGSDPAQDEAAFFDWFDTIRAQAYEWGVRERDAIPYWEDGPVNPYKEKS